MSAPCDQQAESAILATCIMYQDALSYARTMLGEHGDEHFTAVPCVAIWDAMLAVADSKRPVTVNTVANYLRGAGTLDSKVGGIHVLDKLVEDQPNPAEIEAHIAAVRNATKRRRMIAEAQKIIVEAKSGSTGVNVDGWAADVAARVACVADDGASDVDRITGVEIAQRLFDRWQNPERAERPLSTGIPELDRLMRGMGLGQLIIIGAHSGVGKTSLAHNFVANTLFGIQPATEDKKVGALVFSMEMTADELGERIGCSMADVDSRKLDPDYPRGDLTPEEGRRLIAAMTTLRTGRLVVDDRSGITMSQIRAKARRESAILRKQGTPLGIVMIDYAQIVGAEKSSRRKGENREQEVAAVGRAAKELAVELKVPILLCAQLNADAHSEGRLPRINDLRESKALTNDANKVILIWNPDAMARAEQIANGERVNLPEHHYDVVDIIVGKHRGGRTGRIKAGYWPAYTKFAGLTEEQLREALARENSAPEAPRKGKRR